MCQMEIQQREKSELKWSQIIELNWIYQPTGMEAHYVPIELAKHQELNGLMTICGREFFNYFYPRKELFRSKNLRKCPKCVEHLKKRKSWIKHYRKLLDARGPKRLARQREYRKEHSCAVKGCKNQVTVWKGNTQYCSVHAPKP